MDISAYQHMNIRMSTRGKRPLRNLTPSDKVRAIQRIHNGETKASVSRDIGVPESTLRGWCKNEQKLRFMCRQLGTDQISISSSDTPPEKRLKFDNSSAPLKFINGTNLDANGQQQLPLNQSFIPPEYSQLAMMQNFNLLSLLNPNLASMPNMYSGSCAAEDFKLKNISRGSSGAADFKGSNSNSSNSSATSSSPTLSIKNWAKDPSENAFPLNFFNKWEPNDANKNSDVKPKVQLPSTSATETTLFPNGFPVGLPPFPTPSEDTDANNAALMDWCKLFNASLNYIALAAAAAALQQPGAVGQDFLGKAGQERSSDNILYKHLTKESHLFPYPGNQLANSDVSNDSYFDSEPEDLSVRSTNSKISSPPNSRSQSPTQLSSSSSQSDAE